MSRDPKNARASRLLSGRREMSAPERDAIFERVLAAQPRRRRMSFWLLPLALASAVALVVMALPRRTEDELQARGANASPRFRVACHVSSGTPVDAICKPGDKVFFDLETTHALPAVTVFAQARDGEIRWYDVDARSGGSWLGQAAVIARDEAEGTITWVAVFSSTPLERSQVRALFEPGPPTDSETHVIVRRQLQVLQP